MALYSNKRAYSDISQVASTANQIDCWIFQDVHRSGGVISLVSRQFVR